MSAIDGGSAEGGGETAPAARVGDADRPERSPGAPVALYRGRGGELFGKLLLFNILKILTLGVFRFWAITRVRRYIWSRSELLGDAFEYHGTALELFKGFLVALVVLGPLLLAYQVAATALLAHSEWAAIALNFLFFAVVFALWPIGVYRALKYKVSRTSWRGVRFHLDGGARGYAGRWMGHTLLNMMTLGLTWPLYYASIMNYTLNNLRYGRTAVRSAVRAGDVTGEVLAPLLLRIVLFPLAWIFNAMIEAGAVRAHAPTVRLGAARFQSVMRAGPIIRAKCLYLLAAGLILAAAILGVEISIDGGFDALAQDEGASIRAVLIAAAVFMLASLLLGALHAALVTQAMLRCFFDGLMASDLDRLEARAAEGEQFDRGEGLADALGAGGAF